MAVNNPFFTKRETQNFATRSPGSVGGIASHAGVNSTAVSPVDVSSKTSEPTQPSTAEVASSGSKLTVGPNIKLKGVEITDCDTLVVEGTVEATMDSRVMQIAEQGAFHGAAEIDIAEIHGEFVGNLTVRQKLVIHSTGKVSGKIRYGKIVMEEGGQLSGEVEVGVAARGSKLALSASQNTTATSAAAV